MKFLILYSRLTFIYDIMVFRMLVGGVFFILLERILLYMGNDTSRPKIPYKEALCQLDVDALMFLGLTLMGLFIVLRTYSLSARSNPFFSYC